MTTRPPETASYGGRHGLRESQVSTRGGSRNILQKGGKYRAGVSKLQPTSPLLCVTRVLWGGEEGASEQARPSLAPCCGSPVDGKPCSEHPLLFTCANKSVGQWRGLIIITECNPSLAFMPLLRFGIAYQILQRKFTHSNLILMLH